MSTKRILGQYYTVKNPFNHTLIKNWVDQIPDLETKEFAEPFAGGNNLIQLFSEVFPQVKNSQWSAYDIHPEAVSSNKVPEVQLIKQDTILHPVVSDVIVTNPPYIAKNSASKNKFDIDFKTYQNLYEVAVEAMLSNADYVLAIIPESFITRGLFKERLYGFISVTDNLFDDTGIPVGIAVWVKEPTSDIEIYSGNHYLGKLGELKKKVQLFNKDTYVSSNIKVIFNDPNGILGVQAIDNTKTASLAFVKGETIKPEKIKHTSRHITRVTVVDKITNEVLVTEENLVRVIEQANSVLVQYREETDDVFLTSTKGVRADGKYRRRLDFKTISLLLQSVKF